MMKRIGMTLGSALALALTRPALAADPDPSVPAADPALAAEPAALDAALQEADRRFVAGDFTGALAVLETECSRSERPECLFSLGAARHALGHCSEALGYYRRYREAAPAGEQIEEVKAALEEVEARCGQGPSGEPPSAAASAGPPPIAAPIATAATRESLPPPASAQSSMASQLMVGSFALSGAAAVGSIVFGVLAVQSANACESARVYDEAFIDQCEEDGPRYQGLWQGFALTSASLLGIGLTLWWIDSSSTATVVVSGGGTPILSYRRQF